MNILFVCENYWPHYGGAEVVFKNLAEGYVAQGHQVTVVTHLLRGTKRRETINGVRIIRVPSWHSRYVFSIASFPIVWRLAKKADLVQTTTFNGAPPAWLASRLRKKPVVITVHEMWIGKWQEITGFSWMKSMLHDILERMIYLLPFDHYISVSRATADALHQYGIINVTTIYNGLDYEFWNPKRFQAKKKSKEFVFFSWGRPGNSKGFEYLLKAMALLPDGIRLQLMLGSKDQYLKNYRSLLILIKKLGIKDRVTIVPSCPYEELGNHILSADCVVVPSIAEGFGYTTVETTALGKKIIVTDAGSLPEVVSGKYLVCRKKNPKDLAEKMILMTQGKYNYKKTIRFPWDKAIEKYLEVYTALCNTP